MKKTRKFISTLRFVASILGLPSLIFFYTFPTYKILLMSLLGALYIVEAIMMYKEQKTQSFFLGFIGLWFLALPYFFGIPMIVILFAGVVVLYVVAMMVRKKASLS